jgi:hypothetical protein
VTVGRPLARLIDSFPVRVPSRRNADHSTSDILRTGVSLLHGSLRSLASTIKFRAIIVNGCAGNEPVGDESSEAANDAVERTSDRSTSTPSMSVSVRRRSDLLGSAERRYQLVECVGVDQKCVVTVDRVENGELASGERFGERSGF